MLAEGKGILRGSAHPELSSVSKRGRNSHWPLETAMTEICPCAFMRGS